MIKALKTIGQIAALTTVCGAASAALPPVVSATSVPTEATTPSGASLLGMYKRMQQLEREVQQLRGVVEEQTYIINNLKKRQRDLYLDIDKRLQGMESGTVPAIGSKTPLQPQVTDTSQTASVPSPAQHSQSGETDMVAYQKAFSSLKAGRYQQSIVDFSSFVDAYPNSSLIPNALYWLGESSYVTRDFDRAKAEFKKVIELHPTHAKVKDSMLKLGFIEYEQKNWKTARTTLNQVVQQFPESTVATLAKKRLDQMNQDKR